MSSFGLPLKGYHRDKHTRVTEQLRSHILHLETFALCQGHHLRALVDLDRKSKVGQNAKGYCYLHSGTLIWL